jgi:hypothetical protein
VRLTVDNGKIVASYLQSATVANFAATISGTAMTIADTSASQPALNYSYYWAGSSGGFYYSGTSMATNSTFCFEMWIYPTQAQMLWSMGTARTQFYHSVNTVSDGSINWGYGPGSWTYAGGDTIAPAGSVTFNAWNHVAFIGDGSIVNCFINGVLKGSSSNVRNAGALLYIGSYFNDTNNDGSYYYGYMKDVRWVTGSQVYTPTGFTPPTGPLSSIGGTLLLTLQNSAPSSFGTAPTQSSQSPFNSAAMGYSPPNPIPVNTTITGSGVVSGTKIVSQQSSLSYTITPSQTVSAQTLISATLTNGDYVYTNRPASPKDSLYTFQMAPGLRYSLSTEQGELTADLAFKKKPPIQFWN